MLLKVEERLALINVLPREGNHESFKIIQTLKEELSIDENEHKELKTKFINEGMQYDIKADKGKEIEIGDRAKEIIANALDKIKKQDLEVPFVIWELYEKFNKGEKK